MLGQDHIECRSCEKRRSEFFVEAREADDPRAR